VAAWDKGSIRDDGRGPNTRPGGPSRAPQKGRNTLLTAAVRAAKGWPASEQVKDIDVAKPELGTKRLCPHCGAKFYDLSKSPIVCPKCSSVVEIVTASPRGRPDAGTRAPLAPAAAQEVETPETQDAEFVSLEEADAESSGGKAAVASEDAEDEEVEIAGDAEDDSTFLEEEEDGDEDVSDIIGGDIEDEEET
jgi:uncharacterized protein (TIGR02300 family)